MNPALAPFRGLLRRHSEPALRPDVCQLSGVDADLASLARRAGSVAGEDSAADGDRFGVQDLVERGIRETDTRDGSRVRANSLSELPRESSASLRPLSSHEAVDAVSVRAVGDTALATLSTGHWPSYIGPGVVEDLPEHAHSLIASTPTAVALTGPVIGPALAVDRPGMMSETAEAPIRKRQVSSPEPGPRHFPRKKRRSHEKPVGTVNTLDRAGYWDTTAPVAAGTTLWGSTIQMIIDGQSSSSPPLLLLTTRPLSITPYLSSCVVLDLSPKLGRKGTVPCVQVKLTNSGPLGSLDECQLDLATSWLAETLKVHLDHDLPDDLESAKWLILPLIPRSNEDAGCIEKIEISWEEIQRLDGGSKRPVRLDCASSLPTSALQDMVLCGLERPRDRMLIEARWAPRPETDRESAASSSGPQATEAETPFYAVFDRHCPAILNEPLPDRRPLTTGAIREYSKHPTALFLPTWLYRSTSIIPPLLQALDDALLGHELSHTLFSGALPFDLCLAAVTRPSAAPGYLDKHYERPEFLGDAIIRLICDFDLWSGRGLRPEDNSYRANHHRELQASQSNANMIQLALTCGIVPYIRRHPFSQTKWRPDGQTGGGSKGEENRAIGRPLSGKVCADCLEALVGTAFLSNRGSLTKALRVMDAVGLRIRHHDKVKAMAEAAGNLLEHVPLDPTYGITSETVDLSSASHQGYDSGPERAAPPANGKTCWLERVSTVLGCSMSNCSDAYELLRGGREDAWGSHSDKSSIGHQVIAVFIACDLYVEYPDAEPGIYTNIQQSRMSQGCLGAFCTLSGLSDTIQGLSRQERLEISKYKATLFAARRAAESQGAAHLKDFWKEILAPSTLTQYVRAIFADLLCGAGFGFKTARFVYRTRLRPFFERYCQPVEDGGRGSRQKLGDMIVQRACRELNVSTASGPSSRTGSKESYEVTITVHGKRLGHAQAGSEFVARAIASRIAAEELAALPQSTCAKCSASPKGKKRDR